MTIQLAAWYATTEHTATPKANSWPVLIKQIVEKRRLPRNLHQLRILENKRLPKAVTQELKQLFNNYKGDRIRTFLQGLTPRESTDYSLRKVTKKLI
jgi:hypothetical protein